LVKRTLRQLLSWAKPELQPDLAIVLVDQDGDASRRKLLDSVPTMLPVVLAVSVREFEAWLIADEAALSAAASLDVPRFPAPDRMKPGEAKKHLADVCGRSSEDAHAIRSTIARKCDLDAVCRRCRSFDRFCRDLATCAAG
jgi:hypothetical protein